MSKRVSLLGKAVKSLLPNYFFQKWAMALHGKDQAGMLSEIAPPGYAKSARLQEDKDFAAKVIAKIEENEVDEDELIEQRRRKRQELMAKLQQEKEAAGAPQN